MLKYGVSSQCNWPFLSFQNYVFISVVTKRYGYVDLYTYTRILEDAVGFFSYFLIRKKENLNCLQEISFTT